MSSTSLSFSQILSDTRTADAPFLSPGHDRHEMERGVFTYGPFAGQGYVISILNPHQDAWACHAISEAELEKERRTGVQNVKPRTEKQIKNNMSFNLTPPDAQKGGVVVGLYTASDYQLLSIGGVALINEPDDGGRGDNFSLCPLERQVLLNMGITHPDYQGLALTSLIFPHRLNIAQSFDNRDYVVTKVAGETTKKFYTDKAGFKQNGQDFMLEGVEAPNNRLATLGMNMRDVTQLLAEKHPHVLARKIDLHSLHANHKPTQLSGV